MQVEQPFDLKFTSREVTAWGGQAIDSFVLRDFWATEAALGMRMLAYNLMNVFRHTVM